MSILPFGFKIFVVFFVILSKTHIVYGFNLMVCRDIWLGNLKRVYVFFFFFFNFFFLPFWIVLCFVFVFFLWLVMDFGFSLIDFWFGLCSVARFDCIVDLFLSGKGKFWQDPVLHLVGIGWDLCGFFFFFGSYTLLLFFDGCSKWER